MNSTLAMIADGVYIGGGVLFILLVLIFFLLLFRRV